MTILLKHFLHVDNIRHPAAENSKTVQKANVFATCWKYLKSLQQKTENIVAMKRNCLSSGVISLLAKIFSML